jgi:ribosomal peptide maturation radical SAM protein 1
MAGSPVRFVVAPFLPSYQPALGVSSLVAVLRNAGIESRVDYLNLAFRRMTGPVVYRMVSDGTLREWRLGEVLFARALWEDRAPAWADYEARVLAEIERMHESLRCASLSGKSSADPDRVTALPPARWRELLARLGRLYEDAPGLVRRWAREIVAAGPRVVGLSSTFQQNVASLALARELRRLRPREELALLMGGANCEGEMGQALAANFPALDRVVSGEAEAVIVDLVRQALSGGLGAGAPRFRTGTPITELDRLPLPDFEDYFALADQADLETDSHLVAESSRGCWWGAKSHCTFCGLNGETMAFRSKSPARMATELRTLADRYRRRFFMMADNILDMRYATTLLPDLAGARLRFFYEVKANLRKDQLATLAAAGVTWIQPGIESLSTPILRLMRKGTTRLQNVQLLKWCDELGMRVSWNLLYGFPGEPPEEYAAMAELMPRLVHLPPPAAGARVRLDRFSPYFREPARHGITGIRPAWAHDLAFAPLPPAERARIAYFFEFDHADGRQPEAYAAPALDAVDRWYEASRRQARLELVRTDEGPAVYDTREGDRQLTPLSAPERRVLAHFDGVRSLASLLEVRPEAARPALPPDEARLTVQALRRRGWLIEEGDLLLSVVVDRVERRDVLPGVIAGWLGEASLEEMMEERSATS